MENHHKHTHAKRQKIKSKCPKCKVDHLVKSSKSRKVFCCNKKCGFNQKYKGDDFEYQYKARNQN